ncbi:hypothetical protein GW17_00000805 [Ensete ventricosum]|nr:hypothetical protein GW17_00000805 [Ensete ventricosum]RZR85981.1 hypothetical protein BHM03_00013073 [Ensete ventricosum]
MRTRMWCPAHLGVGSYAHRDMTTIDGEPTKLETGRCQLGSLLCSLLAAQTSPGTLFFWHLNSSGVDRGHFFLGLVATLGAAGLFAVYLPVMQLVYRGVKWYRTVVEVQLLMEASAGMVASGWWRREDAWDLRAARYWVVVGATATSWQLCFMGTAGMVFLTSSVHSGICMTPLLPVNVVGGVLVFGGSKAVAMLLCLWGFASYLYGTRTNKEETVMATKGRKEPGRTEGTGGSRVDKNT